METTTLSPMSLLMDVAATRMKHLVRRSNHLAAFDVTDSRSPAVIQRIVELLSEHARLAYQFYALSDGPWQIFWSPDRQSFLPFHERGFTLVAFSDPVGPEQDREALLEQFFAYARAKGKHALIIMATETVRKAALSRGFAGMWVGTELFFNLAQYSLHGKTGGNLRQAINHIRHLGGAAREIHPLQNEADRQAMKEVELLWKDARARRHNTSFMGTKPMENAYFRRYFAVETPGSPKMQSFLVCSPLSRRGWYLQDLVRRPDAPRGATEMVAVAAMETFRAEGIEFVTMGMVPLYDPTGQHTPAKTGPLIRWGIGYWDRQYRFSGLQMFRSKFSPTHTESAYILYWPPILTPLVVLETISALSA